MSKESSKVDLGWVFLAVIYVCICVFSRGCSDDKKSNFEKWLEAKYKYEVPTGE